LPPGFWLQKRKGKEARERAEQVAEQEEAHGEEQDEGQRDGQEAAEGEANTQQRTRSGRATNRRRPVAQEDGDDDDENDAFEPAAPPKKKRNALKKASKKAVKKAPRKKKTQTPSSGEQGAEVDGAAQSADGAVQQPSRRRGGRARREREPTPDEAEDEEIDPEKTLMFSLAKRNTRTGKLSEREKKMRQINWAEVRQRQREEDMVVPDRWETQREVNERLAKAAEEAQEAENAQYRPGNAMALVDGEFVNVRPTRNRAQEEQDAFDAQEIIEEDDLTQRVTQKSFMRDNKRFPQDFMLPGQGKRWTQELTDKFYQALEIFRTDFAMINTIFPGMTRRSIKLKFNREEREHPERVKVALRTQRVFDEELSKEEKISRVWTDYLSRADKTNDAFLDADRIKAELAAEEEQMREQIEEAKAQHAADKEQRRKAGLPVEDDEIAAAAEKENAGKKKRKKRDKQPLAFAAEEGVEILGEIDD
jgi:transcription factor TFIIIB component B''